MGKLRSRWTDGMGRGQGALFCLGWAGLLKTVVVYGQDRPSGVGVVDAARVHMPGASAGQL